MNVYPEMRVTLQASVGPAVYGDELTALFILVHLPCTFHYLVQWPANAQLFHNLWNNCAFVGHLQNKTIKNNKIKIKNKKLQLHASSALPLKELFSGICCTGGWMGPGHRSDESGKENCTAAKNWPLVTQYILMLFTDIRPLLATGYICSRKCVSAFQTVGTSTLLTNYLSRPLLCEFTAPVQCILTHVLSSLCLAASGGSFRMQKRLLNSIPIRTIKGAELKAIINTMPG
jgi:hypothetical protein